jgi:predicted nucleotidyltransferase
VSADLSKRRRRATLAARKAAELLRREFGAETVLVFGSLARHGGFTLWSDIDLAARGILPVRFFEAVGAVTGMSAEFKIDLIDLETCPVSMREAIERDGRAL